MELKDLERKKKKTKMKGYPQIFELCIVESLPKGEKKTGQILFEETIKYKKFQEPNLSSSYSEINSKKEFIDYLIKIKRRIIKDKLFPILHIETHGSENGIHLANGELYTWEEFFTETRDINIALKNSLILNLAMCYGISLIGKVDPIKRAPFRAVVATSKEIKWKTLLEGFEIFYDTYFFSLSARNAVIEANKVLETEGVRFNYLQAEHFIEAFTDTTRDPVFLENMINDFAVREKATNPAFKELDFKYAYEHSKSKVMSIMEEAKNVKDFFLMKDIKK